MFKKTLVFVLCLCLVLVTTACGKKEEKKKKTENTSSEGQAVTLREIDYTDPSIYTIDSMVAMGIEPERVNDSSIETAVQERLEKIENNPDTLKPAEGGKYVYVANGGTDGKGYGLEPDKPVETIEYANLLAKEGDVVVLKRGNFWRTHVIGKEGVSYGAYGEGNKPTIYGSLYNAVEKKWEKVEENIYKVESGTGADIGLIVFDHGKAVGNKKNSLQRLAKDYDFYCKGGYLYVYSSQGDPSKIFSDIEFCHYEHIVKMKSNSTIQNWRVMYGGAHGIQTGNAKNIVVDGCVVGFIGGCYQMSDAYVRFGNGIEVWGSCDGYTIKNCHVYQCFDAGITMQFQGETENTIVEQNILFEGNLLELNYYNIEYFLNPVPIGDSKFKNVLVNDNIIKDGGFGWGYYSRSDRTYGTNVMGNGTNVSENFVFTNNTFLNAKSMLLVFSACDEEYLPTLDGNTYVLYRDTQVIERLGRPYNVVKYGQEIFSDSKIVGDKNAKVILYEQ